MQFEIHAPPMDPNRGSVPVSWCVDRELLELLARKASASRWS